MNFHSWPEEIRRQCRVVKAKRDVVGHLIATGSEVYAYHRFRIFVPDTSSGDPPTKAAAFDIDPSLFDDFFVEEPKKSGKG